MLDTPVAFLIFNRPDLTKLVFQEIRKAKPQKLLVVADGPRSIEDEKKCQAAREVIQQVDWDCQILTNFSDTNLGCKQRISGGLNWVFSQVEEAIILEDDCLPSNSFFQFCEVLINRYRTDNRIMHISGDNFQSGQTRTRHSYYFSKYPHIWGWATWRRAWKYYDVAISIWPECNTLDLFDSIYGSKHEKAYWINIFDSVFAGKVDTWDYQWLFTCWLQNGLAIIPNSNLISNIGFREDSTHLKDERNRLARIPTKDIWEIVHPEFITRHLAADSYVFDKVFDGEQLKKTFFRSISDKLINKANAIYRQYMVESKNSQVVS